MSEAKWHNLTNSMLDNNYRVPKPYLLFLHKEHENTMERSFRTILFVKALIHEDLHS
jgi:hypothetical protein